MKHSFTLLIALMFSFVLTFALTFSQVASAEEANGTSGDRAPASTEPKKKPAACNPGDKHCDLDSREMEATTPKLPKGTNAGPVTPCNGCEFSYADDTRNLEKRGAAHPIQPSGAPPPEVDKTATKKKSTK